MTGIGGRITLTGITRRDQPASICRPVIGRVPPGHRLVMSTLATAGTLAGRRSAQRAARYARRGEIGPTFAAAWAVGADPMLSYDRRPGWEDIATIARLIDAIGVPPRLIQLNGAASVDEVRWLCGLSTDIGVILQLPPSVLEEFDGRDGDARLADFLGRYVDAGIVGVLPDKSCGGGVWLDVGELVRRFTLLGATYPHLDLCAAGGLKADNLARLVPLLRVIPTLSVDVESGVLCPVCGELLEAEAIAFVEAWLDVLEGFRSVK